MTIKVDTEEKRVQKLLQNRLNKACVEAIFTQYTPLVEKLARRFVDTKIPIEDLVQEAYIGLNHAVINYDKDKGVKFITYAQTCIVGKLRHFIRDHGQIIKEPAWLHELSQRVKKVHETFLQQHGVYPTSQETADLMGLEEDVILNIETTRPLFFTASLEEPINEDGDTLLDRDNVDNANFISSSNDNFLLENALVKLKPSEQQIVQLFYYKNLSRSEIAKILGISNNYVSHIIKRTTTNLQRIYKADAVKSHMLSLKKVVNQIHSLVEREMQ